MNIFSLSEITSQRDRSRRLFLEFLRSDSLSAGLYELKSGSEDPQTPHAEDEIYYIIRGRGMIRIDNDQVLALLGLEQRDGLVYSLAEIQPNLKF